MIRVHRCTVNADETRAKITLACSSCTPEHRIDFETDIVHHPDPKVSRAAGIAARVPHVRMMAEVGCKDAIAELGW